jgi:AcrR family transcriptional regulator
VETVSVEASWQSKGRAQMSQEPTVPSSPRRVRADARDNHDRLLQAARAVFEEQGPTASLNEVARRANVGPGTLYRHFPNMQAILAVLINDDVDELCANGRGLLADPSPSEALQTWLRAVAIEATSMKGLVATQLAAQAAAGADPALAGVYHRLLTTGYALLERAQAQGGFAPSVDIRDLMRMATAIAWASVQTPDDTGLLDRLLTMAIAPSLERTIVFSSAPNTVLPTRGESKGLWGRRRHGRDTDQEPPA